MDTPTVLLIGLLCTLGGLVVGLLTGRTLHPGEQERKTTEHKLKEAQERLQDYEHEVTEHFIKTSELFNNLSHSYRDVHEYLSASAMRLTGADTSKKMVDAGFGRLEERGTMLPTEIPEPPKDYAPKVPGGILSEEYGLRDHSVSRDNLRAKVANDAAEDTNDNDDPTLKVS